MIKVLHVIPSLSAAHGGPSRALPAMERAISMAGAHVETATTDDDGPGRRMGKTPCGSLVENGVKRWYFPKQTEFYKVSRPLAGWLTNEVTRFDLVHVHALFSYTSVAACRIAKKAGVPYIIRPLGVLNSYGMNQSKSMLKRISLRLVEGSLIQSAAAIHFITEKERVESEALPYTMHSKVIPIGVGLSSPSEPELVYSLHPRLRGKFIILFMGRINLVKGLETLLEALSKLETRVCAVKEVRLVIAGSGTDDYISSLRHVVQRLGIAEKVIWLGHVDGDLKSSLLSAANLFVVPSQSESFGIAMVEALAAGLPVIASPGVAIAKEVESSGACRVVERDAEKWARAIADLVGDRDAREELGRRAEVFAKENYSLEVMGARLVKLYESVIKARNSK